MLTGKIKFLNNLDKNFKSSNSIKSNFIDDEIYKDAIEEAEKVKNTIEENKKTPFFKQLSKDLFNSLYKVRPEMYGKENLPKSLHMENEILKEFIDNSKFDNLRGNTCGDIFNSTISLGMFQDKAIEIIEEWTKKSKENEKTMKDINNAIDKQQQLQQLFYDLENGQGNENIEEEIKKLTNEINKLNKNIGTNNDTSSLKQDLNSSIKKIDEQVQQNQDALESFGMSNKGGSQNDGSSNKTIPFEQKKKLIDVLNKSNKFKEVINELGRLKQMVGKINKKPSKYGQAICDIGVGNNINKILSTEKAKLIDNDLEFEFYKRYANKSLLEYKTRGIEESKGPIVVCLDISGSMDGKLEMWSKAVTIASLQIAMSQKRAFRCIAFNYRVVETWDIDKLTEDAINKVVEIAEIHTRGGTNFQRPLQKAIESIEESKFRKADILFITDGEPSEYLDPDFKSKLNNVKSSKGCRVQSIMLGDSDVKYLKEFSDSITTLKDLNKDNELVNIFNSMTKD